MIRGRPLEGLRLTVQENNQLVEWARRRRTAQALALRARIVLACGEQLPNREVARRLRVTPQTVGKWRSRFVARGAPRRIDDAMVEAVIAKTLEDKPRNATHWSTRAMARAAGVSQSAVVRIWHAFGLQPHREETFKLSTDPLFIDKVRDIVGLYLDPPVKAMVLCVDEKSQIQALDRTQPIHSHRSIASPPSRQGVFAILEACGSKRARGPGGASGHGQLRYAQDAYCQSLVRSPSPLQSAFHANFGLVA